MDDIKLSIGARITELRLSLNLSVSEFARRIGVSRVPTISEWSGGISTPQIKHLIRISRVFGVNLQWLLTGQGPREVGPVLLETDPEINELCLETHTIATSSDTGARQALRLCLSLVSEQEKVMARIVALERRVKS